MRPAVRDVDDAVRVVEAVQRIREEAAERADDADALVVHGPEQGPHLRQVGDVRLIRVPAAQVVPLEAVAGRARCDDHEGDRDRGERRDGARGSRRAPRGERDADEKHHAGGDRHRAERVARRPQPALRDRAREEDREACRDDRSGAARQRGRERGDRQRQRECRGEVAQVECEPERVAGGAGGGLGRDQEGREREQRHASQHPDDGLGRNVRIVGVTSQAPGEQAQDRADDRHRQHGPPPTAEPGGERRLCERAPEVRARQVVGDAVAVVLLEGRRGCRERAAQAGPRQRVADREQIAGVPESAGHDQRAEPQERGPGAPATGGDHDHADREREHRGEHRELGSDRETRGDCRQRPGGRAVGLGDE